MNPFKVVRMDRAVFRKEGADIADSPSLYGKTYNQLLDNWKLIGNV